MVRLPDGLREKIREASDSSGRSMNAEFVHRIEESFSSDKEALREASRIAEELRRNLTVRIEAYDRLSEGLAKRAANLDERERKLDQKEFDLNIQIEEAITERREELEKDYQHMLERVQRRWKEADEYAGFTVARERQFIETIKALTGKEPPPAEPVIRYRNRKAGEKDDDK